jgi:Ala-tRNA(Pro) deacylase
MSDALAPEPERALMARLEELGIATTTVRHPPVATVEAARQHRVSAPGAHVKNLFLRDKKGAQWLLTTLEDRQVDLRALRAVLGARGGLTFGSAERLQRALGVMPGAVTPLAAINDRDSAVTVVLDAALRDAPAVHCHPLHNEATTAIAPADLVRFLRDTGHEPVWAWLEATSAEGPTVAPLWIRPATLDDVPALVPLAAPVVPEAPEPFLTRVIRGTLEHPASRAFLVAERQGRLVGYSRVGAFEPPADAPPGMVPAGFLLVGLVVDPAARRQGIGRALTEARLAWIDARGGEALYWTDDDNVASIELHRALGFEPIARDFVFVTPFRDDRPKTLYRRPHPLR